MNKPSHKQKTGKTIQPKPADYDHVLSGVLNFWTQRGARQRESSTR